MGMIYLQSQFDTEDDKCVFYYVTAQRTRVCAYIYINICTYFLSLILYVFFPSLTDSFHYSAFIHRPFI